MTLLKFYLSGLCKTTMNQQTTNHDFQASLQYLRLKTVIHENSLPTKKCDTEEKDNCQLGLAFSMISLWPLACFDSSRLFFPQREQKTSIHRNCTEMLSLLFLEG